ncbi:MAG: mannitol dehydrogenase family protein [Herbaspirillum sp.]
MDKLDHRKLSNADIGNVGAAVTVPGYDRQRVTAGIAHIGVGNFHRAHAALYVDRCLHLPGQEAWGICGIGLGNSEAAVAKAAALRAQDGLYTLTEFAPDGTTSCRVIGALVEYLHAPSDPEAVLKKLAHPSIRIVSLTITEGGYNFDEASGAFKLDMPDVAHDLAGGAPRSMFGFIVEALRRRRVAGHLAFTVVSCDNLRQNGDTARRAILAFADALDADLARWIGDHVAFPNSMVDRIVPTVTDAVRARVADLTGIDDASPVVGEAFTQWVIEDRFSDGRPRFAEAGVELRDDVEAYEAVKGRMLNASHMLMSYPSLLLGYRFVHDAMKDPDIVALLTRFLASDVEPLIDPPAGISLQAYREKIIERFSNPEIGDQLLRVAHDGASKLPVFHTKTITQLAERDGDMRREALLLACFQRYLRGVDDSGVAFDVNEVKLTEQDWALANCEDPAAVMRMSPFSGLRLDRHRSFIESFRSIWSCLEAHGCREALRKVL